MVRGSLPRVHSVSRSPGGGLYYQSWLLFSGVWASLGSIFLAAGCTGCRQRLGPPGPHTHPRIFVLAGSSTDAARRRLRGDDRQRPHQIRHVAPADAPLRLDRVRGEPREQRPRPRVRPREGSRRKIQNKSLDVARQRRRLHLRQQTEEGARVGGGPPEGAVEITSLHQGGRLAPDLLGLLGRPSLDGRRLDLGRHLCRRKL